MSIIAMHGTETIKAIVRRSSSFLTKKGRSGGLLPTASGSKSGTMGRAKSLSRIPTIAGRKANTETPHDHLTRYPAYYMTPEILIAYLEKRFPSHEFRITMQDGCFEFYTPAPLEESDLTELRRREEEANKRKWMDENEQEWKQGLSG